MNTKDEKKTTNEKPVTFSPLNFQEALADLMKVNPEPKPAKKPRKKRTTTK